MPCACLQNDHCIALPSSHPNTKLKFNEPFARADADIDASRGQCLKIRTAYDHARLAMSSSIKAEILRRAAEEEPAEAVRRATASLNKPMPCQ
eukprot:gnl/MRDRNA2_/MRDRNA2_84754_c0_seq1.p2 gnl/MRDRNA2_/MRDRNA2_84754_c0~~gnl/MRDRNA2_/MRDRNA2_84754_c0_seq1.p2  ORF type:complete len:108 (-),score=10.84 gnl/MRDRNA2_/MRDRNA2_84754_c0_seq1:618-896(-)